MLLDDIPSAGVIKKSHAERLTLPAEATSAATLAVIARISRALRARGAVVVVYPAWRPDTGIRLVRLARSVLRTDRVAGIPLQLPPLAFSLVADQLAYLSGYVKPGVLASMAVRLSQEVFAGAWVNSVARLEHIETGIGEHLSSYLPGTDFMVSAAPRPHVHRISSSHPVAPISHRPMDPIFVIAAHQGGDVDWVKERFKAEIGARSLSLVAEQPLSADFWRAKKYVEFVAFSGHPRALQTILRATPTRRCTWCGEPTGLETCLFCGMTQRAPTRPPPPAPQASDQPSHRARSIVPSDPSIQSKAGSPQSRPPRPASAQPSPPAPAPPRAAAPPRAVPARSRALQPEHAASAQRQGQPERRAGRPAAGHQSAPGSAAARPPSRTDDIEFPPARAR
ncbi:hypothetical protein [Actinomadura alba]|uniref:Uncharacterized protein n=1 Tax=Actinomadura alba TaxID=406431 RepID=A0ABR7LQI3_9ACTN|nr:hypothetical protein [Actinomadura alba]MBC6467076.1 hypothetical protein [Actinomadura alba]